jgi:hypothetical protein
MIVLNLINKIWRMPMSFIQIERLKKDISEAQYYQKRLIKKGKHVLAYKMGKKIDYMHHTLNDMKAV